MTSIDVGAPVPATAAWQGYARAVTVWLGAALVAFALGGILVLIAGGSPVDSLRAMFQGALGSVFSVGQLLVLAIPLLVIGLGLAVAFRGRVYNIGAEGQLFMGALAGGALLLTIDGDGRLMIGLALVAGTVGGALWGAIVGVLRARWGVNEVISSLLLTYIALFIFGWAIRRPFGDPSAGNNLASRPIPEDTLLGTLPDLFVHYGLFVAIALVPVVGYVMARTPFGFRVRAMGLNLAATEVAGVRTGRLVIWLMLVSGGLAGLAGIIQVVGIEGRLDAGISQSYGFTAIVVALLGRLNAFGVLLAALFIAFLNAGGQAMSVEEGLPYSIVLAIQGVFVLLVLVADRFSRV
ncbi:MAG: ABC transporter permease [Actinobacteria bacterium]|nr:ABC transporter permease [Actinomycetota bacterium]